MRGTKNTLEKFKALQNSITLQVSSRGVATYDVYIDLKGQCHKIFAPGFFHESSSSKPLKIRVISIFSQIRGNIRKSRCTIRYLLTTPAVVDCARLKWTWMIYILTLLLCPNIIFKTFLIDEFFHLPLVHLELRVSPWIFAKYSKRSNWIHRDLGGNWCMKKPKVENLEALSL